MRAKSLLAVLRCRPRSRGKTSSRSDRWRCLRRRVVAATARAREEPCAAVNRRRCPLEAAVIEPVLWGEGVSLSRRIRRRVGRRSATGGTPRDRPRRRGGQSSHRSAWSRRSGLGPLDRGSRRRTVGCTRGPARRVSACQRAVARLRRTARVVAQWSARAPDGARTRFRSWPRQSGGGGSSPMRIAGRARLGAAGRRTR